MTKLIFISSAIIAAMNLTGCYIPVMKPSMVFHKAGIQAYGAYPNFGAPEEGVFDYISIDPSVAPEFLITFTDGYQTSSKTINEDLLKRHAYYFGTFEGSIWGRISSYKYDEDSSFLQFSVSNGSIKQIKIADDCKSHDKVFGNPSSNIYFPFPTSYSKFKEVFGPPAELNTSWAVYVISRTPCPSIK